MAVKIFAIILLLVVMEITFLSTKEPITLEISHPKINFSDVTFENLKAHLITPEGMKGEMTASAALIYKTHDQLYHPNAILYFKERNDTIRADEAIYRSGILHLRHNVRYRSDAIFLLKSDDLVYNIAKERAVSHSPFWMEYNRSTASGKTLLYDAKKGYVKAHEVVFTHEEEDH